MVVSWLTASFLSDRVPKMPKLIPGLGQPIEKRVLTAPYVHFDTSPLLDGVQCQFFDWSILILKDYHSPKFFNLNNAMDNLREVPKIKTREGIV